MKNLLLILFILLLFLSCSSDDSSSDTSIKKKPSRITIENFGYEPPIDTYDFYYDGFNITKIDMNNGQIVIEFFYQNNQLTNYSYMNYQHNNFWNGSLTYSNNQIQKLEINDIYNGVQLYEYTYNNSNQVVERSYWATGYQEPWITHYSYDSKNRINEVYKLPSMLPVYFKYEYDNNPHPFKYVNLNNISTIHLFDFEPNDLFMPKINNVIKIYESTGGNNNYGSPSVINHIYDNDGYPIRTPGEFREYRYEYSQ